MNKQEFLTKYHFQDWQVASERDILWIIASNLSDLQEMGQRQETNDKINTIKQFIFDYTSAKSREALNTPNF